MLGADDAGDEVDLLVPLVEDAELLDTEWLDAEPLVLVLECSELEKVLDNGLLVSTEADDEAVDALWLDADVKMLETELVAIDLEPELVKLWLVVVVGDKFDVVFVPLLDVIFDPLLDVVLVTPLDVDLDSLLD